jgi:PAS domain-containing protein
VENNVLEPPVSSGLAVKHLLPALVSMLDSLQDSVVILDKDWRYLFVNKTGWKVLKREKEDVLGGDVWRLLPHLKGTKFETAARNAVKTQIHTVIEEYYPHRNEYFRTAFYPSKTSLAIHITNITDLVVTENMNKQLLGNLQEAMEVYWSDENQALREQMNAGMA